MKLIADSGSTKTIWRFLNREGIYTEVLSPGINPFYQTEEDIIASIQGLSFPQSVSSIYFYGAGCSTDEQKEKVKLCLQQKFNEASVTVDHDLLGTARGILGSSHGVACILGTGSNSCLYNGNHITQNIASLGYHLGDEGSGSFIGKAFLKEVYRGQLPQKVATDLSLFLDQSLEDFFKDIYSSPLPNRLIASTTKFIFQHRDHDWCQAILSKAFSTFFEVISTYPWEQINVIGFTGSIADVFEKELKSNLYT